MIAAFALVLLLPATTGMAAKQLPAKESVVTSKDWNVAFTQPINPSSVNATSVYVVDAAGTKMGNIVSVSKDNAKVVVVKAPTVGYKNEGVYTLHISQSVTSTEGIAMKDSAYMKFTIEKAKVEEVIDYKQFVLGSWNTEYSGFPIQATFNKDMTTNVVVPGLLNSKGDYTINGSQMTMDIMGKQVSGTIQKISDNKFTITSSGSIMTFTK